MPSFQEPSAFESVLRFLGRPGYAVRNVLKGNVEGAGRQVLDMLGDLADAPLPGDWIPEFSRKQDYTEGSDLVGGMDPGILKTATDIGLGLATDPLTYFGGPIFKGAGAALKAGVKAIPGASEVIAKGGSALRSATNNLKPSALEGGIIGDASNKGKVVGTAAQEYVVQAFGKVDPLIHEKAMHLLNGVADDGTGVLKVIDPTAGPSTFGTNADQLARIDNRLSMVPWDDPTKLAVKDYLNKVTDYTRDQWVGRVRNGVAKDDIVRAELVAGRVPDHAPLDYMPRFWEAPEEGFNTYKRTGGISASTAKGRTLTTPEEYIAKLKDTPLEMDPAKMFGRYGEQSGKLAQQAQLANKISKLKDPLHVASSLQDPALKANVATHIEDLAKSGDLDTAQALKVAMFGLEPRNSGVTGPLFDALHKANSLFKPFATGGAFIPRPAFTVRNLVSSIPQVLSTEGGSAVAGAYAKTLPGTAVESFKDWFRHLGLGSFDESRYAKISEAALQSGGNDVVFLTKLKAADPMLASGFENGVLGHGFVSSEQLIDQFAKAGDKTNWKTWRDAPQAIVRGSEDRMRQELYEKLLASGKTEKEAAKFVNTALFEYGHSSEVNRALRDVIPFMNYTAKAVPQFAGAVGRNPWLAGAIRPLYTQDDNGEHPVPQWLANQSVIPLGSENGKSDYLTSLGMPWEVATSIPNLSTDLPKAGRQIEQGVVSQLNPALKFGYTMLSGKDPYFGSEFMGYDKTPDIAQAFGAPKESQASRYYNMIASSGMIQPLASPIQLLSQVAKPDQGLASKALGLSGLAKVATVDDKQALQQQLQSFLATDPNVKEYKSFYTRGQDEDTLGALEELKRVQKALRARKKAEQSQQLLPPL